MKKLLVSVLVILMVFSAVTALAADAAKSPLAIDMVVIIDNSEQMMKADKDGLRFDAAAALISMCDAEYSRATYFMFDDHLRLYDPTASNYGFKVIGASDLALYDIKLPTDQNMRKDLIGTLTSKKIRDTKHDASGQAFGRALNAAVSLLSGSNNGNKKVIVMLTAKLNKKYKDFDDQKDEAAEAKAKAEKRGIEIYTVVVGEATDDGNVKKMATNGHYQKARKASDLPHVFNEFYADMVGSDAITATGTKKNDGSGEIRFEVPNASVSEVNIIVPISELDGDYSLSRPGKTSVYQYKGDDFATIKLVEPAAGEWVLSYQPKDQSTKFQVQYIFSYSVQVSAETEKQVYSKHEPVTVTAVYTEDGQTTKDMLLYKIGAKITLKKGDKTIVSQEKMATNASGGYTITFDDLAQYGAGTYTYTIDFEGDGLIRKQEALTFELVNDAPVLSDVKTSGDEYAVTIDIPNDASSYEVQASQAWDLSSFVMDPNGDAIAFAVVSNTAEADPIIEDGKLTIYTRKDKATVGDVTVSTVDSDGAEGPRLTFHVDVTNFEARYDTYTARFTKLDGVQKNESYTVEVSLYDAQGHTVTRDEQLPETIQIDLTDLSTGNSEPIALTRNGARWTGTMTTGDTETSYQLTGTIAVGQKSIQVETMEITIGNRAPVIAAGAKDEADWPVTINDPADAASYQEQTKDWDLSAIVEDPNGDAVVFSIAAATADVKAWIDGTTLHVQTRKDTPTQGDVVVRCEDNDGAAGPELTFHITVTSYEERYTAYTASFNSMEDVLKNGSYELTLVVRNGDGKIVTSDDRLPATIHAEIRDRSGAAHTVSLERSGSKWIGTLETDASAMTYTVTAHIPVGQVAIDAEPLTVEAGNRAPVLNKGQKQQQSWPVTINDPQVPDSYQAQKREWKLTDIVSDPDGDALTFRVVGKTADVDARVEGDGTLVVETKKNTPTEGDITVSCEDNDGTAGPELTFHIQVKDAGTAYQGYTARLTVDRNDKSSDLVVSLAVYDAAGIKDVDDINMPDELEARVTRGEDEQTITLTRGEDGVWTGKLTVNEVSGDYLVETSLPIGSEVTIVPEAMTLRTVNSAPVQGTALTADVPAEFKVDPFLIWSDATGTVTLDLNKYFSDPNDDPLTYAVTGGDGMVRLEGSTLTIDAVSGGAASASFTVTATDNEDASVTSEQVTFRIVSLKSQGIKIIIIAVAAIVVLLIVIQMLKPKYPKARFVATVDGMPYGNGQDLPSAGSMCKKPVPLNNYVSSMAQSACGGEIVAQLKKIVLKPAYGSVKVDAGKTAGVTVKVGTADKKGSLTTGGTVKVTLKDKTLILRLEASQKAKSGTDTKAKPAARPAAAQPKAERSSHT